MLSTQKRRFVRAGVAAGVLLLAAAVPALAAGPNLVNNGNFTSPVSSTPNGTMFVTPGNLPGWTIEGPKAEINAGNVVIPPAGSPAGTQIVDLAPDVPGALSQIVPTVAGKTYQLTFGLAGNPAPNGINPIKQGTASINGAAAVDLQFDTTGRTFQAMGWVNKAHTFTATGPSTLRFGASCCGDRGPMITNVSVVEVDPAGAPLANGTIALAAMGGLAAVAMTITLVRRRA